MIRRPARRFIALWVFTTLIIVSLGRSCLGQGDALFKSGEATGVVVDEAGKPVAGVELDTLESALSKPERTDDKGMFRFLVERDPRASLVPGLIVARDGHARLGLARIPPFSESIQPLRIVLEKPSEAPVRFPREA